MKVIHIDANSIHEENGEIYISEAKAKFFNLSDGMEVNVYSDEDVWNAVIHKFISSDKCESWYVELCDLKETLDEKQTEWNTISFMNSLCLGEEREKYVIAQRMIDFGYSLDEIYKIVCMDDKMKSQVRKIVKFDTRNISSKNT